MVVERNFGSIFLIVLLEKYQWIVLCLSRGLEKFKLLGPDEIDISFGVSITIYYHFGGFSKILH